MLADFAGAVGAEWCESGVELWTEFDEIELEKYNLTVTR
jgi:hypothetical protein